MHHDFSDIKVGDTVFTAEGVEGKVEAVEGGVFKAYRWWWGKGNGSFNDGGNTPAAYLYRTRPTLTVPPMERWAEKSVPAKEDVQYSSRSTRCMFGHIPHDARNVRLVYEVPEVK